MKIQDKKTSLSIAFSLLLIFLILPSHSGSSIISAGISSTLDEIELFFAGISNFIEHLGAITSMIGFKPLLLFIIILFLSAGFSAIGIPRGKQSFFLSLFVVNGIWVLWKESFAPESLDYIFPILKTNLILITPLLIVSLFKFLFPAFASRIISSIRSLFGKKNQLSQSEARELLANIQGTCNSLEKSLVQDILLSKGDTKITLSPDTNDTGEKLANLLSSFTSK